MINAVTPLPLDHFDVATITTSFQLVTDTGLSSPCSFLNIVNDSNVSIVISFNGVADNDYVIRGKEITRPHQNNSRQEGMIASLPKGAKIWVRAFVKPKVPLGMIYFVGF